MTSSVGSNPTLSEEGVLQYGVIASDRRERGDLSGATASVTRDCHVAALLAKTVYGAYVTFMIMTQPRDTCWGETKTQRIARGLSSSSLAGATTTCRSLHLSVKVTSTRDLFFAEV